MGVKLVSKSGFLFGIFSDDFLSLFFEVSNHQIRELRFSYSCAFPVIVVILDTLVIIVILLIQVIHSSYTVVIPIIQVIKDVPAITVIPVALAILVIPS